MLQRTPSSRQLAASASPDANRPYVERLPNSEKSFIQGKTIPYYKEFEMRQQVVYALRKAFERCKPDVKLDPRGYMRSVQDNLLPDVNQKDFIHELRAGAGEELKRKFLAVHSSSALVVNCFAPFRERISDLSLSGRLALSKLEFEKKCPTGLRGTPPHLDVMLYSNSEIIGIESGLTEHLTDKEAKFSAAYDREIRDDRRNQGYFKEMHHLLKNPTYYSCLDAAQLIKHAFGLSNTFKGRPVRLLYIYWEPLNWQSHQVFARHRKEIEDFSNRVKGSSPTFSSISYPQLWETMSKGTPGWRHKHVQHLRERYLIEL